MSAPSPHAGSPEPFTVVYGPDLASYSFSDEHPLQARRYTLTMALLSALGWLDDPGYHYRDAPFRDSVGAAHRALLPLRAGGAEGSVDRARRTRPGRPHLLRSRHRPTTRSSPRCTTPPPSTPEPPSRPCRPYWRTGRSTPTAPRAASITPTRPKPRASASTTTPRPPSLLRSRRAAESPTWTSTPTTATECRPPSTTIRGCSPYRSTNRASTSFPAPATPTRPARAKAEGACVNIPLPAGRGRREPSFRRSNEVVGPALRTFAPDILVTQTGADTPPRRPAHRPRRPPWPSTPGWPAVSTTSCTTAAPDAG